MMITKTMRVSDVITLLPECEKLLAEYGMHCAGCMYNGLDTLEEGCQMHGFSDADVEQLLVELNEMLKDRPERPHTITVTKEAAVALRGIIKEQGKSSAVLEVGVDERGGFSMDVLDEAPAGSNIFKHREVSEVSVAASDLTLSRIGGATIDYRENRFKLDLPEDQKSGCACGGECDCKEKGEACACKSGAKACAC